MRWIDGIKDVTNMDMQDLRTTARNITTWCCFVWKIRHDRKRVRRLDDDDGSLKAVEAVLVRDGSTVVRLLRAVFLAVSSSCASSASPHCDYRITYYTTGISNFLEIGRAHV